MKKLLLMIFLGLALGLQADVININSSNHGAYGRHNTHTAGTAAHWSNTGYLYGGVFSWNARNYYVFDVSGLTEDAVTATLSFTPGAGQSGTPNLELYEVATAPATLTSQPGGLSTTNFNIFNDLGSGSQLTDNSGNFTSFSLNATAINLINASGGLFAIGITNTDPNSYHWQTGAASLSIATPEPAEYLLMLVALLALVWFARSRSEENTEFA